MSLFLCGFWQTRVSTRFYHRFIPGFPSRRRKSNWNLWGDASFSSSLASPRRHYRSGLRKIYSPLWNCEVEASVTKQTSASSLLDKLGRTQCLQNIISVRNPPNTLLLLHFPMYCHLSHKFPILSIVRRRDLCYLLQNCAYLVTYTFFYNTSDVGTFYTLHIWILFYFI